MRVLVILDKWPIIYVPTMAVKASMAAATEPIKKAAGRKIKNPDSKPRPYIAQTATRET